MGKIVGNIVGLPSPQPDWNQTDPTKANYIKNKPKSLKPEFANSIDECVDTNLLYVLPDGYIYAYMGKYVEGGAVPNFTDLILDTGIVEGMYLSNGDLKADGRVSDCSDYIDIGSVGSSTTATGEVVIRMSGVTAALDANFRIAFYDDSKTYGKCTFYGSQFGKGENTFEIAVPNTVDENGNITMFDISALTAHLATSNGYGVPKYIRISAPNIDSTSILTVNEEIAYTVVEGGTVYEWVNTGHRFVGIDIENPIIQDIIKEEISSVKLKPNFANSIDECVDTSAIYVLPDGHIYRYGKVGGFTNVLPKATSEYGGMEIYGEDYNEDGNPDGYKKNTRYGSSGAVSDKTGWCTTGFIPIALGDVIRLKNVTLQGTGSDSPYMDFWQNGIRSTHSSPITAFGNPDENGVYTWISTQEHNDKMRLSIGTIDETSIITINEEITENEGGYEWIDTGIPFVDGDIKEEINDLNKRISILESGGVESDVVGYVREEAERVAKNVYSHQNANTFTFLAISDMHEHITHNQIMISNIHAGQGMDLVRKNINVDFAVCLGDNGWGSATEGSENRATIEKGVAEIRSANAKIDAAFRGIPNFRTIGNHCPIAKNYTFNNNDYLDENELFPLYGAYNTGAIYPRGEKDRGYCYRDFEDWKLRVICMNSSDLKGLSPADGEGVYTSGMQLKWFAELLDMSDKSDVSEWSILILSHLPLDYFSSRNTVHILDAYLRGDSVDIDKDGVAIEYDYKNKNQATVIANIHGHNHCFKVDKLYLDSDASNLVDINRICIPNACSERSNERGENNNLDQGDIEYGEETSYEKVPGTAQDTSFCVVTIDPVARKIYADCYGAGYDREISY